MNNTRGLVSFAHALFAGALTRGADDPISGRLCLSLQRKIPALQKDEYAQVTNAIIKGVNDGTIKDELLARIMIDAEYGSDGSLKSLAPGWQEMAEEAQHALITISQTQNNQ